MSYLDDLEVSTTWTNQECRDHFAAGRLAGQVVTATYRITGPFGNSRLMSLEEARVMADVPRRRYEGQRRDIADGVGGRFSGHVEGHTAYDVAGLETLGGLYNSRGQLYDPSRDGITQRYAIHASPNPTPAALNTQLANYQTVLDGISGSDPTELQTALDATTATIQYAAFSLADAPIADAMRQCRGCMQDFQTLVNEDT